MYGFLQDTDSDPGKKSLLELVDDLQNLGGSVTITKNGMPSSILMNIEDFESLTETLEILADPEIMKSLHLAKKQIVQGRLYSDEEVWEPGHLSG